MLAAGGQRTAATVVIADPPGKGKAAVGGEGGVGANRAEPLPARSLRTALRHAVAAESSLGETAAAIIPVAGGQKTLAVNGRLKVHAWSAIKIPLAAAYLSWSRSREGGEKSELMIGEDERRLFGSAIAKSRNRAARDMVLRMIDDLGSQGTADAIEGTLAEADVAARVPAVPVPEFQGSLAVGLTEWRINQAAEFYRALFAGCLSLTDAERDFLLGLMASVREQDRWGVARVFPGDSIAFKGGWAPETETGRYTVQQFAIVGSGSAAYVLGIAAAPYLTGPPSGSKDDVRFLEGQEMIQRIAARVEHVAPAAEGPALPGCEDRF